MGVGRHPRGQPPRPPNEALPVVVGCGLQLQAGSPPVPLNGDFFFESLFGLADELDVYLSYVDIRSPSVGPIIPREFYLATNGLLVRHVCGNTWSRRCFL